MTGAQFVELYGALLANRSGTASEYLSLMHQTRLAFLLAHVADMRANVRDAKVMCEQQARAGATTVLQYGEYRGAARTRVARPVVRPCLTRHVLARCRNAGAEFNRHASAGEYYLQRHASRAQSVREEMARSLNLDWLSKPAPVAAADLWCYQQYFPVQQRGDIGTSLLVDAASAAATPHSQRLHAEASASLLSPASSLPSVPSMPFLMSPASLTAGAGASTDTAAASAAAAAAAGSAWGQRRTRRV